MARIGIDARLTHYTQGGIAQYTQHLIRELAAIDARNDYLILHSRKDRRCLAAGENQRRVACWTPAHHRLERFTLAAELLPHRLDLLHSPDFIPPYDGTYRSVITIHDLAFLHYPEFLTPASRRYYNSQIAAAVRRADHIITVSEATRADVINLLHVAPDRVAVVPEAAAAQFRPASLSEIEQVRAAYNLPPTYILFVGTFEPRKNLGGLLRAYADLHAALPDAPPLVIVGQRGWLYEEIFDLSARLGLTDQVLWLENVGHSDLPPIYSAAQVFCLPSFYEGFGLPPLEAMACGTPVVVSNRASLPEVVGGAALLVDPDDPTSIADALQRVIGDPALADDLRQRGLERAGEFSWRETARRTLAIYERTLESSS